MKRALLLVLVLGAIPQASPTRAQVAGHDTLPSSGPAARERHERTAEDPVLVQVERLRQDLARFGKSYRKATAAERARLEGSSGAALEEIQARVRELQDSVGAQ